MRRDCSDIQLSNLSNEVLLEIMNHWKNEYTCFLLFNLVFGAKSSIKEDKELILDKYSKYLGECNARKLI